MNRKNNEAAVVIMTDSILFSFEGITLQRIGNDTADTMSHSNTAMTYVLMLPRVSIPIADAGDAKDALTNTKEATDPMTTEIRKESFSLLSDCASGIRSLTALVMYLLEISEVGAVIAEMIDALVTFELDFFRPELDKVL